MSSITTETPSPAELAARSARIAPLVPTLQSKIRAIAFKLGRSQDAEEVFQDIFELFLMTGDVSYTDAAIVSYYSQSAKWQMLNAHRSDRKHVSLSYRDSDNEEEELVDYDTNIERDLIEEDLNLSNLSRLESVTHTLTATDQKHIAAILATAVDYDTPINFSQAARNVGRDKKIMSRVKEKLAAAFFASEAAEAWVDHE